MSSNRQLFITATDTGVGKTLISGLLLGYLRGQGDRAEYQKWVATGCAETVADLERVKELSGQNAEPVSLDLQVPYRFPFPASPHLAAEQSNREIDPELLVAAYEIMRKRYEILLLEGVGGLLVPLRRELLLVDLIARLKIPALLVARSGLGSINHTLLSLEAMRKRNIPVLGVLFTDGPDEEHTIVADNLQTVGTLGRVRVFGRLRWSESDTELIAAFQPLGAAIRAALNV